MTSFAPGHTIPTAPRIGRCQNCIRCIFLFELEARCAKKGILKLSPKASKGFVRRKTSSKSLYYLYLLDGSTLWQCDFDNSYGCVELIGMNLSHSQMSSASAYMDFSKMDKDNTSFIVEVDAVQHFGAFGIVDKDHILKASPIRLCLKAPNQLEAADWVRKICSDSNHQFKDDDAIIWLSESMISSNEYLSSVEDFDILSRLKTLEGTLANDSLRLAFRKYLEKQSKSAYLSFWEHAEDFRRACAKDETGEKFSFVGTQCIDNAMKRDWARSIYDLFLAQTSPLQVSTIYNKAILDELQSQNLIAIDSDIFSQIQNEVFQVLKHGEGFHSSFIGSPECSETFILATAAERRLRSSWVTSSEFDDIDDKITDSDLGVTTDESNDNERENFAKSIVSIILGSTSSIKQKATPDDKQSVESQISIRDTWWRNKNALKDAKNIKSLPGWWWQCSNLADLSTIDAKEILIPKVASSGEKREELAALYRKSELDRLLSGKYCSEVVLPSLLGSVNYSLIPQLETFGTVKFVGSMMVNFIRSGNSIRRFSCSIVEFRRAGRILLYNQDGTLAGRILLERISSIQASKTKLHSFNFYEGDGASRSAVYEISCCRHVSERQSFIVAQSFFREVSQFCPKDAISIVHSGFVDKREEGATTVFRRRWAVLLSSGILAYFKPSDSRNEASYRGEIRLGAAQIRVYAASGPLYFSIEIPARKFQFRVDEKVERDDWARILGATAGALKRAVII